MVRATKKPHNLRRPLKWFLAVFCGAWVLLSVLLIASRSGGPHETTDLEARVAGRVAVERVLKAPSTADFHSLRATKQGDVWTVAGSVDAQNSFGATIRSDFVCSGQIAHES